MMRKLIFGLCLLCLPLAAAFAQTYPSRPITILVGLAAGGVSDVMTRIYAASASQETWAADHYRKPAHRKRRRCGERTSIGDAGWLHIARFSNIAARLHSRDGFECELRSTQRESTDHAVV